MSRPKALDLFCGAGGASMGLHLAGFDVTGVDIRPQPRYPFTFVQADALTYPLEDYDFVWASPPCQQYTAMLNHGQVERNYPQLIGAVRDRLTAWGGVWVVENVPGAPLEGWVIMLCGAMFGLRVYRHRHFECSVPVLSPLHPAHAMRVERASLIPSEASGLFASVVGKHGRTALARKYMGVDWVMSDVELSQAIPPAYSEYLGRQIIAQLERVA